MQETKHDDSDAIRLADASVLPFTSLRFLFERSDRHVRVRHFARSKRDPHGRKDDGSGFDAGFGLVELDGAPIQQPAAPGRYRPAHYARLR
jgi:hypothetical protein